MQLEKFPFDKQTLKAYIIPFWYNSSEVKLVVEPNHQFTVQDYVRDHLNVNIAEFCQETRYIFKVCVSNYLYFIYIHAIYNISSLTYY